MYKAFRITRMSGSHARHVSLSPRRIRGPYFHSHLITVPLHNENGLPGIELIRRTW